MLSPTAKRAVEAYGGEERWLAATAVEATVSTGGLIFPMKWQRRFRRTQVRIEVAQPHARIQPIGRHGNIGILDGEAVRLEDANGNVIAARADPRRHFPYGRRSFWWDDLDLTYFSGYAFWNYLSLPALLLREDIAWTELSEHSLEARFPPGLPSHCEVQRFYFDAATGLLRRHDYTAEAFGGWARGAHIVQAHGDWEGLPFPSKRRVTPRGPGGRPLPVPVLVWIEVHDWRLV